MNGDAAEGQHQPGSSPDEAEHIGRQDLPFGQSGSTSTEVIRETDCEV